MAGKSNSHWIEGAIKHPGALHRELHVPAGKPIPERKLAKAEKAGGKEGERARLAETLKGMRHRGASAGREEHGSMEEKRERRGWNAAKPTSEHMVKKAEARGDKKHEGGEMMKYPKAHHGGKVEHKPMEKHGRVEGEKPARKESKAEERREDHKEERKRHHMKAEEHKEDIKEDRKKGEMPRSREKKEEGHKTIHIHGGVHHHHHAK